MNMNQKQTVEGFSIKSDQLISFLMILGNCAQDIEDEELKSSIFLARNLAQEIDVFIEQIRLGKL